MSNLFIQASKGWRGQDNKLAIGRHHLCMLSNSLLVSQFSIMGSHIQSTSFDASTCTKEFIRKRTVLMLENKDNGWCYCYRIFLAYADSGSRGVNLRMVPWGLNLLLQQPLLENNTQVSPLAELCLARAMASFRANHHGCTQPLISSLTEGRAGLQPTAWLYFIFIANMS